MKITLLLPTRRQSLSIEVPDGTSLADIKAIKDRLAGRLEDAEDVKFLVNGQPPKDDDLTEIEAVFAEKGIAVRVGTGFKSDDAALKDGDVVVAAREQKGGLR